MLWIKVADTGIGMSAAQVPVVIEPFQQADASLTRKYGGSGLGLSICHELVQMLGGAMVYASSPGVGCIFVVAVPCELPTPPRASLGPVDPRSLAAKFSPPPSPVPPSLRLAPTPAPILPAPPASAAVLAAAPASSAGGRPTVVIADDNPVNIHVLRRQLQHLGCDTVAVVNGQECVDLVTRYYRSRAAVGASAAADATVPARLDAIFMDLHMPVMDGIDAARAIRRYERERITPSTAPPIVAVTADDPELQAAACAAAGMTDFLRKPIILDDLRALLVRLGLHEPRAM